MSLELLHSAPEKAIRILEGAVPQFEFFPGGELSCPEIPLRFAPFDRASFAFALLRSGQASPFDKGGLRGIFSARVLESEKAAVGYTGRALPN